MTDRLLDAAARARVRALFATAAADGSLSTTDVQRIIKSIRRDRLTETEAITFAREVSAYHDEFTPQAKVQAKNFIDDKMRRLEYLDPGPRPNPFGMKDPAVLPADKDKLEQQEVKGGQLFVSGVNAKDADQDYIGDCYLMAAMSAVAHAAPEAITHAFKDNGDGTFTVRLYAFHGKQPVAHEVKVDADVPADDWYGLCYARGSNGKELWPAMLEKAFAVKAGSYAAIEGGESSNAMAAITGKPSTSVDLRAPGTTAEKTFELIREALKASKPITAGTLGDASASKFRGKGLYADHEYTVLDAGTRDGKPWVKLRNPWGYSEPKGNGRDDGVFEIPFPEFMSLFSELSVNG